MDGQEPAIVIAASGLKPCPFCGGSAREITTINDENCTVCVECSRCGSRSLDMVADPPNKRCNGEHYQEISESWNRRTPDPELIEENQSLKNHLAKSNLDCIYCGLPKSRTLECQLGIDGCLRLNDTRVQE